MAVWSAYIFRSKKRLITSDDIINDSYNNQLLVVALRHKTGGPGLGFLWGPWKFLSCPVLLPAFSSPGVHSAFNRNEHQGISLGLKCGRLVEFDSSAVQVVSNVKRMEAQRFVPFLCLHDLLPLE